MAKLGSADNGASEHFFCLLGRKIKGKNALWFGCVRQWLNGVRGRSGGIDWISRLV
jgi:hypothetical protein